MARPQKSPDDRASAAFRVRLTAAERALLDTKATAAGCESGAAQIPPTVRAGDP